MIDTHAVELGDACGFGAAIRVTFLLFVGFDADESTLFTTGVIVCAGFVIALVVRVGIGSW